MKVTFDHSREVAPSISTFYFKPDRPVRYIAGQFIELFLPHEGEDERGHKRWFTLSSSPTEPLLAITTKFAANSSSFKRALKSLKPGDEVTMAEPMGDFVLPKDPTIPLVFVAAGMGVTPSRSMVTWLTHQKEARTVHTLYLAHSPEQLAFGTLLKNYSTSFTPFHTDFTPEAVVTLAANNSTLVYIAGPEPFVEDLYKHLQTRGIEAERLVADYFPGYSSL